MQFIFSTETREKSMRTQGMGIIILLIFALLQLPQASLAAPKKAVAKSATKKPAKAIAKAAPARKTSSKTTTKTRAPQKRSNNNSASARKVAYQPQRSVVIAPSSAAQLAGLGAAADPLRLSSSAAMVMDPLTGEVLFAKNTHTPLPIASLTKLMTALVVVEAGQDMNEILQVTNDDIDRIKGTSSRLPIGARLSRADMLHIALMSSENRAASALGRHYPGGQRAFVAAMNAKARRLGMNDAHFVEPTGLSNFNVASASSLAKLVAAAQTHPSLANYSISSSYAIDAGRAQLQYVNSNRLVGRDDWNISLQKTGYISEAGRCMVLHATLEGRPVIMVLLDANGTAARVSDAQRLRDWVAEQWQEENLVQAMLNGELPHRPGISLDATHAHAN